MTVSERRVSRGSFLWVHQAFGRVEEMEARVLYRPDDNTVEWHTTGICVAFKMYGYTCVSLFFSSVLQRVTTFVFFSLLL